MIRTKKKISRQLFLFILVLAIVPVTVLSFSLYYLARKELETTSFMHMNTVALDYASHVDLWLNERTRDAGILSRLPSIRHLCLEYSKKNRPETGMIHTHNLLEEILKLIRYEFSSFYRIHVLDRDGSIIASTSDSPTESLPGIKELKPYKVKSRKQVYIGHIHFHKGLGWFTSIILPIHGSSGNRNHVIGYIVGDLETSHSLEKLKKGGIGLGKTGEIYVVSKSGIPITRLKYSATNPYSETAAKALLKTEAIRKLLRGQKGTSIYRNYAGNLVVGSYLWIPKLNIGVVAEIDSDEIMKPLKRLKFSALITLGILLLLSALITYYVSEHVSAPIVSIAETAKKISEGNLDQRLNIRVSNEIGQLASAFNSMTDQLRHTIEELKEREASVRKAYRELKRTQAQLVQSEKMAAIGELVASVVHEMRNPLSSIKLNLQIIGRHLDRNSRNYEHYKIAIDQVSHLDKMFTELLDFSKPIILEKVLILPEGLIDLALKRMKDKFGTREIEIIKKIPDDLPAIEVDVDKVIQVLVNIFDNALDAIENRGRIEIEGRLGKDNSDTVLKIAISDNGSGIPEHQLEHIFSTFFTTKKKGTGLGLTIVKKIMEAHHGKIEVKSKPGEGTTVILMFPVPNHHDQTSQGNNKEQRYEKAMAGDGLAK